WRFDAPRLSFGAGAEAQALDGLLVAGGRRKALVAERIDAGALLMLASLSPEMPAELAAWLGEARPSAVLHGVELVGGPSGQLRAQARIEDFGFGVRGAAPGLSGLSGSLRGDAGALVFTP